MSFEADFQKYGLTEETYRRIVEDIHRKFNGEDLDWAEIVEKYNLSINPDTLRKANATIFGGYFVSRYYEKMIADSQADDLFEDKLEQVKKERIKLSTEKLEYNAWLRENAREELFVEKIINALREECPLPPVVEKIEDSQSDREDYILGIADVHFGKVFESYGLDGEVLFSYSPDICVQRLNNLMFELIGYLDKEGIRHLNVVNLGDSLDGFLRHSQLKTLKYGVVDSAIIFGKFFGKWLNELSKYVCIDYYQTNGNHGELRLLDGLKNGHLNDNIEKVVLEIIKYETQNSPNITIHENKSGLIHLNLLGLNYLGVHGEVKNLANSLSEFEHTYDKKINYILAGHRHHKASEECGHKKGAISFGSIIGSDDYSMRIRKTASATSTLIGVTEDGVVDEHTFYLD